MDESEKILDTNSEETGQSNDEGLISRRNFKLGGLAVVGTAASGAAIAGIQSQD